MALYINNKVVTAFPSLAHQILRFRGAYRIGSCPSPPSSSVIVVCQHFKTISPVKPLGQLGSDFISGILGLGDRELLFLCENWILSFVAMST